MIRVIRFVILSFLFFRCLLSEAQPKPFPDGVYTGYSRASYTAEPYWGIARVTVKGGVIAGVSFMIRDSALHETFSAAYEKHFAANPLYVEQCRNDWKGVQTYPAVLLTKGDPGNVDAISGATWSYNIFIASVKDALGIKTTEPDTVK